MLAIIFKVLGLPRYAFLATLSALALFSAVTWFPNYKLIGLFLSDKTLGLVEKMRLLFSFYSALPTMYGWPQVIYLILVAILFGLSLSMNFYYINLSGAFYANKRSVASGAGGLIASILGIGCASCGTLFLAPLLGVTAGGIISALPFRGLELSMLGLVLLAWSLYKVIKKIGNPYG